MSVWEKVERRSVPGLKQSQQRLLVLLVCLGRALCRRRLGKANPVFELVVSVVVVVVVKGNGAIEVTAAITAAMGVGAGVGIIVA